MASAGSWSGRSSIRATEEPAELLAVAFRPPSPDLFVNAQMKEGGWVRAKRLDADARPIPGLAEADCPPITGDSTSHALRWRGVSPEAMPIGKHVHLRLRARNARLYSIYAVEPGEPPVYHRFSAPRP